MAHPDSIKGQTLYGLEKLKMDLMECRARISNRIEEIDRLMALINKKPKKQPK